MRFLAQSLKYKQQSFLSRLSSNNCKPIVQKSSLFSTNYKSGDGVASNLKKDGNQDATPDEGLGGGSRLVYGILAGLAVAVVVVDLKAFVDNSKKTKQNVLIDNAFAECQVTEIKQINHDTWFYKIRAKNEGENAMPLPYHILIKDDTCQVARSYSPVTINEENLELGLVIKHYKDGVLSQMLKNTKIGESILVSGPICSMMVPYRENSVTEIGMIAGGTGITPMYQLVKRILQSKTDKTRISLYYLNKTRQDILLQKELDHFAKTYPDRFKLVYGLDQLQVKTKSSGEEKYIFGRPDEATIASIMPSPSLGESNGSCVLVCGPDG